MAINDNFIQWTDYQYNEKDDCFGQMGVYIEDIDNGLNRKDINKNYLNISIYFKTSKPYISRNYVLKINDNIVTGLSINIENEKKLFYYDNIEIIKTTKTELLNFKIELMELDNFRYNFTLNVNQYYQGKELIPIENQSLQQYLIEIYKDNQVIDSIYTYHGIKRYLYFEDFLNEEKYQKDNYNLIGLSNRNDELEFNLNYTNKEGCLLLTKQSSASIYQLELKYENQKVNIILKNNGGFFEDDDKDFQLFTINKSDSLSSQIIKEPKRDGYSFDGWYYTSDYADKKINLLTETFTKNSILYAHWKKNIYKISYKEDRSENAKTIFDDTSNGYIINKIPKKEGYSFVSWTYINPSNKEVYYAPGDRIDNIFNDIILTPNWELLEYTVTFMDSEGTYLADSQFDITKNELIKGPSGYKKWSVIKNDHNYEYVEDNEGFLTLPLRNIDLYGVQEETVEIIYNCAGFEYTQTKVIYNKPEFFSFIPFNTKTYKYTIEEDDKSYYFTKWKNAENEEEFFYPRYLYKIKTPESRQITLIAHFQDTEPKPQHFIILENSKEFGLTLVAEDFIEKEEFEEESFLTDIIDKETGETKQKEVFAYPYFVSEDDRRIVISKEINETAIVEGAKEPCLISTPKEIENEEGILVSNKPLLKFDYYKQAVNTTREVYEISINSDFVDENINFITLKDERLLI